MTDGRTPPPEDPDLFPADPDAQARDYPATEPGELSEADETAGAYSDGEVDAVDDLEYDEERFADDDLDDEVDGEDMDDEDFEEKFGDGISAPENERSTQKRTLALAIGGLLIGAGVVLGVLNFVLPDAHVTDVRPDLQSKAEGARDYLKDVHKQNLEALTRDGAKTEPTMAVVCGLVPGDAPRKEQCELRATTVVPKDQLQPAMLDRLNPPGPGQCYFSEAQLEDFKPLLMELKDDKCKAPSEYRWATFGGAPRVESVAGWLMSGQISDKGSGNVAITTRHDLGQFDIGECPESGCGVDQIQLPKVDYKAVKLDDQSNGS